MIAPDRLMQATITLLACLIATGCTELDAFFEEEPKTCEQACEDNYIGCLEWELCSNLVYGG